MRGSRRPPQQRPRTQPPAIPYTSNPEHSHLRPGEGRPPCTTRCPGTLLLRGRPSLQPRFLHMLPRSHPAQGDHSGHGGNPAGRQQALWGCAGSGALSGLLLPRKASTEQTQETGTAGGWGGQVTGEIRGLGGDTAPSQGHRAPEPGARPLVEQEGSQARRTMPRSPGTAGKAVRLGGAYSRHAVGTQVTASKGQALQSQPEL